MSGGPQSSQNIDSPRMPIDETTARQRNDVEHIITQCYDSIHMMCQRTTTDVSVSCQEYILILID
jgi:hypothetical protein